IARTALTIKVAEPDPVGAEYDLILVQNRSIHQMVLLNLQPEVGWERVLRLNTIAIIEEAVDGRVGSGLEQPSDPRRVLLQRFELLPDRDVRGCLRKPGQSEVSQAARAGVSGGRPAIHVAAFALAEANRER